MCSSDLLNLSTRPKIIMATAYGKEEILVSAEEVGFSGVLIKPVQPSFLFDTIMNAFGRRA